MNEIEVKAKLKDKDAVMNRFKEMGLEIHASKHQKDTVFFPNNAADISRHELNKNYLRIREQKTGVEKKVLFTLKQSRHNQLDSIEHEVEIKEEDILKMFAIFELLGFYQAVIVEKERITAKMGDIEVCIDDVVGLGSFIELEKFSEDEKSEEITGELYSIFDSWGIKKEDYVYVGYDTLMEQIKKHDFNNRRNW